MSTDPFSALALAALVAASTPVSARPTAARPAAAPPVSAPFAGVTTMPAWGELACSAYAATASGSFSRASFERTPESAPGAPYYAIDLVTTKNLPGTARAAGTGHLTFTRSPFGVALAADGSYRYDVEVRLTGMQSPERGKLVAWITTPQVDRIQRLGSFDDDLSVHGQVSWNKFLVVVTLEDRDDPAAKTWSGPIALRGMSRSGMMHTMAGHGPFQQELCAKYGY
jgi:hypothetical protein